MFVQIADPVLIVAVLVTAVAVAWASTSRARKAADERVLAVTNEFRKYAAEEQERRDAECARHRSNAESAQARVAKAVRRADQLERDLAAAVNTGAAAASLKGAGGAAASAAGHGVASEPPHSPSDAAPSLPIARSNHSLDRLPPEVVRRELRREREAADALRARLREVEAELVQTRRELVAESQRVRSLEARVGRLTRDSQQLASEAVKDRKATLDSVQRRSAALAKAMADAEAMQREAQRAKSRAAAAAATDKVSAQRAAQEAQQRAEELQRERDALAKELDERTDDDSATCAICFERRKDVVLEPCGHTLCHHCADIICATASPKCHLCRAALTNTRPLFL